MALAALAGCASNGDAPLPEFMLDARFDPALPEAGEDLLANVSLTSVNASGRSPVVDFVVTIHATDPIDVTGTNSWEGTIAPGQTVNHTFTLRAQGEGSATVALDGNAESHHLGWSTQIQVVDDRTGTARP